MSDFWKKLWDFLSSLFHWDPVAAEKKNSLKNIYRMLSALSPPYFKERTKQVLPGFAKIIFALASNTRLLEDLMRKTVLNKDSRLVQLYRDYLIEARLPENERLKKVSFSYNELKARVSASLSPGNETTSLTQEFSRWIKLFESPEYGRVNDDINELDSLCSLCRHNFEPLLVFFDPRVKIGTKSYKPVFNPVLSEHVIPDLLDIYFILANFRITDGMERCLNLLVERLKVKETSAYKTLVKKTLQRIDKLLTQYLDGEILLNLMRAIKEDPAFRASSDRTNVNHIKKYIDRLTNQFKKDSEKIFREVSENAALDEIKALFGDNLLIVPEGYNEEEAHFLHSEGFNSFSHVKPFTILKNFFIYNFDDKAKKTITKLIVEGFFDDKAFQNDLSTIFSLCEKAPDKIIDFEQSVSGTSDTSIGMIRSQVAILKSGKKTAVDIDVIVNEINKRVSSLIEEETNRFNQLSYCISDVLNDMKNKTPALVANIKVIGGSANNEFIGSLNKTFIHLRRLIHLMQNFTVIKQDLKHRLESGSKKASE